MGKNKSFADVVYDDVELARFLVSDVLDIADDGLATRLIYKYGGLDCVFGASFDDLMRIRGITPRAASFFSCARAIERQAMLRTVRTAVMRDIFAELSFIAAYCLGEGDAFDFCMTLDKKMRLIDAVKITSGEKLRQAVRIGCEANAAYEIAVHYIPPEWDEDVTPSDRTLGAVNTLARVLAEAGIVLYDYIAYTPGDLYSLRVEKNRGADFAWSDTTVRSRRSLSHADGPSEKKDKRQRRARRSSVSDGAVHLLKLRSDENK